MVVAAAVVVLVVVVKWARELRRQLTFYHGDGHGPGFEACSRADWPSTAKQMEVDKIRNSH